MADRPKDRAQATLPEQSDGRPTLLIFERAGLDLNRTVEEETDDRNADLLERVDRQEGVVDSSKTRSTHD